MRWLIVSAYAKVPGLPPHPTRPPPLPLSLAPTPGPALPLCFVVSRFPFSRWSATRPRREALSHCAARDQEGKGREGKGREGSGGERWGGEGVAHVVVWLSLLRGQLSKHVEANRGPLPDLALTDHFRHSHAMPGPRYGWPRLGGREAVGWTARGPLGSLTAPVAGPTTFDSKLMSCERT